MDLSADRSKIDKLLDDNFYTLKHRIQLVISFKELDGYLEQNVPTLEDPNFSTWRREDQK